MPDGAPRASSFQQFEAIAGRDGFIARYIAAEGSRFWRVLASSRDGRTWAVVDEAPTFWSGSLGPRLAVAGDRFLLTSNESYLQSQGPPMVIGDRTRSFVGVPAD